MNSTTTRPTLREIRAAARDALDYANLYGVHTDDVAAHPGDHNALKSAQETRAGAVDAIAHARWLIDTDAEDDRGLAGALKNLRRAEDVMHACDAALGLGSAASMAVAS